MTYHDLRPLNIATSQPTVAFGDVAAKVVPPAPWLLALDRIHVPAVLHMYTIKRLMGSSLVCICICSDIHSRGFVHLLICVFICSIY